VEVTRLSRVAVGPAAPATRCLCLLPAPPLSTLPTVYRSPCLLKPEGGGGDRAAGSQSPHKEAAGDRRMPFIGRRTAISSPPPGLQGTCTDHNRVATARSRPPAAASESESALALAVNCERLCERWLAVGCYESEESELWLAMKYEREARARERERNFNFNNLNTARIADADATTTRAIMQCTATAQGSGGGGGGGGSREQYAVRCIHRGSLNL
jgi:hypothetical protein